MLRATIYLLACSMFLGIVMGGNLMGPPKTGQVALSVVNGYSLQCQVRGADFVGACSSQNLGVGGGFRCDKIFCALPRYDGTFLAVETGKAQDGTHCKSGHWCQRGECVRAGDAPIPSVLGPGPKYNCQDPMKIRIHGSYSSRPAPIKPEISATLAALLPATMPPRTTASKPSTSTSSSTVTTQNPSKNRAVVGPTPGSPNKKKKIQ